MRLRNVLPVIALFLCASSAYAQSPTPYGAPITVDDAKRVAASALAEARKNNWNVAVAEQKLVLEQARQAGAAE